MVVVLILRTREIHITHERIPVMEIRIDNIIVQQIYQKHVVTYILHPMREEHLMIPIMK